MPLDDALDIAHHLAGEIVLGRQHQNPEIGIVQQEPGAEDADQRGLAGVAEDQEHEAAVILAPAPFQPLGDLEVQGRRRLALATVPEPDELPKADRGRCRCQRLLGTAAPDPARAAHR